MWKYPEMAVDEIEWPRVVVFSACDKMGIPHIAIAKWVGEHHYALATELSIAQFTDEGIKPGMRYKIGDLHLQVIEYYEEIDVWSIARVEE